MIRTLGIYLLTAFGLLGTLSIVLRSPALERLAHASLASPVLIVYSERGDQARYRIMSSRFKLELTDSNGTVHGTVLDRKAYNQMVESFNSMSRHIITLPYFSSLVLHVDAKQDAEIRTAILKYGFCNRGQMTTAMGISSPVTHISLKMISNEPQLELPPALEIECTK